MRILAIRGRNLASLAGDFEICLDAPPLADAGLFAITGRTGSGKSTTLDALCLALFDRMPRLPAGRGVEVGRADDTPETRLRNNDVRSILRRGTGKGHAEVDFLGVDRRRYRARWSVRRARERAEGRCQFQTMSLHNLDSGEDLSGNKMEVLAAIRARLGLTFDQFRRSVLLAQGDFAAFLRADAGERAELLERITGTGIYSEISKAAHLRAAEEKKQLEMVRQRLGDQRPLDEEERKALEAGLADARRARDEQLQAQQVFQLARRWHQTLDKLAAERDQAGEQLVRTQAAQTAAEPRRREFERIRVLQPLRLPLAARDRAADALDASRRDLERSIADEGMQQSATKRTAADAAADEAAFEGAQKTATDAAPSLQAARRLDTLIQGAREQTERAEADSAAARRTLEKAQEEQDGLQTDVDQAAATLAEAGGWLASHASVEPLAAQWDAWTRELERYAGARLARDRARADVESVMQLLGGLADQRRSLDSLIAQIGSERERMAQERAGLEARATAMDLGGLAALRDQGLARRAKVEHWRRLVLQAIETQARLASTQATVSAVQARRTDSEARVREIASEIGPLAATVAEAEDAYRRLLLAGAGEVEALRARLKEGHACPVCGAEKHPWAHRAASAIQDLIKEQEARVAAFKRRFEALSARQARGMVEIEQADRRSAELASELETRQTLLDSTLESWSACELDALRLENPFDHDLAERLAAELDVLAGSLKKIADDEANARRLLDDLKARTERIEELGGDLDAARKKLVALDAKIAAGTEACNRAEGEGTRAENAMSEILGLVAGPLAGIEDWLDRLQQDPATFVDICRREVEAWRQSVLKRDDARKAEQDLAPRFARVQARRHGAQDELARCISLLNQQSEALAGLDRERAALLGGQAANLVEVELEASAAQARKKQEQSRLELARVREMLTAARGVVAIRRQTVQEQEVEAIQARQVLDRQMADHELTLDQLREALKRNQDWVEQERLALRGLEIACDDSRKLLGERERRVEEHRSAERPKLDREAVAVELPRTADTLKAVQEHWGSLHGRLAEDDRKRDASRAIQAELERRQATWELWESLRELIGSADGSKFRNFAQGLTLDLLVAHANQHLRDLARRYELQRVPGAEMEIQVIDREMGDAVRSIHSLSGGESFLASLALALGLASLASDRVEVESLFIDEGFGALDADSLDLAIASLDALYSLGRQVGVISHVETLVERIGVKVQVTKQGGGRSRLEVVTD